MKRLVFMILFSLVLIGCKSKEEVPEAKPVVEVRTALAEIADLQLTVRAPATIFPREQANVASRITARISRLNVRKGDRVTAGQVLARLENRDLIALRDEARAVITDAEANLHKTTAGTIPTEIERARGQVAMAQAALNQAQKTYDRRKLLFEQGAIPQRELLLSETELSQAKTTYEVAQKSLDLLEKQSKGIDIQIAQSRLEQAHAKLAEINAQLEFAEIRSPFAGVITEQMMFPGDMAKPDAPIFTVMDLAVAVARAQTPEPEVRSIHQGQTCSFVSADQESGSYTGRITVLNQAVDPARRTVEVWCQIANAQQRLRGSEFGALSIMTGALKQSVVVPVSAVQFADEGKKGTVMVVDDKHIAHAKEVETGEVVDGKVRIVEGLQGGETVIIEGGYSLPDGTEVRNKEEKETDKKGKDDKDDKKGKDKGEKEK